MIQPDQEDADPDATIIQEEEVKEGQVAPSEYDYLLTMPLWSLSEEKITELNTDMKKKKDDHDALDKTHIYRLWEDDLDMFLEALGK